MDELLNDICFMLQSVNKYDELTRQRLVILMSRYKIERASTEVAIYEGDVNGNISQCCNGKTKTSYGYEWSYLKGDEIIERIS